MVVWLGVAPLLAFSPLRLRGGGDAIRSITDKCAGIQILGGSYGYAYPEDNIRAFGGISPTIEPLDKSMMRYLAVAQAVCGATILAGQGSDQKTAECVAIGGAALGVLMMAPGYELAGGPKLALASWFMTLAALGEARRRDYRLAGAIGAAVLGVAGLEAATMPRTTLALYGTTENVSEMAYSLLSLGGANQIANVVYLAVARGRGHSKGLLATLLVNAVACLKFGVCDASRAGFKRAGALGYAVLGSLLAGVAARKS